MQKAVAKAVEITFIPVETPAQMGQALADALTFGYRGTVEAYFHEALGKDHWRAELNGPGNLDGGVVATLGDVYIWDGTRLSVVSGEDFAKKYQAK